MNGNGAEPAVDALEKAPQSAETEGAILDAARQLLAEGGVAALSMRVLADRVGLSATAIYHYFDGKEDLVRRVVRQGYQRFGQYLHEAMAKHEAGSLERVFALGDAYIRFAFENREYFRVLYSIQPRSPRDREELPEGGGYGLLRKVVVEAMESGAMREGNPDLVAHYLWASVHGLVTLSLALALQTHDPDCEVNMADVPAEPVELFRALAPMFADGIRAADGKPGLDHRGFEWWSAFHSERAHDASDT